MWEAGAKGSIDEQTIGFQERCKLKTRIKYKVEGDGFQCDAHCDAGYTYSWLFRFEKLKPMDDSFSPLHNRTLMLLSTLRADFTKVWMDNLYLSKRLVRRAKRSRHQLSSRESPARIAEGSRRRSSRPR